MLGEAARALPVGLVAGVAMYVFYGTGRGRAMLGGMMRERAALAVGAMAGLFYMLMRAVF
jgi:hypothetical protein